MTPEQQPADPAEAYFASCDALVASEVYLTHLSAWEAIPEGDRRWLRRPFGMEGKVRPEDVDAALATRAAAGATCVPRAG